MAPHNSAADIARSWTMVAGDASFRRYFRLFAADDSYIVMDAPPAQENVPAFIEVANTLRKAGLRAPCIYAQDIEQGFLLLEDFGDQMLKQELAPAQGQRLFTQILPLLSGFTRCDCSGLPRFDEQHIHKELALFADWYLARHCEYMLPDDELASWRALGDLLVEACQAQPQVFIHRDFHSCNLQRLADGGLGIIDFQDAMLGPASYDLASWLWDRYLAWPRTDIEAWVEQARASLAPQLSPAQWLRYCDLTGLQRNIKVVGIFARLHYRDGKPGYLEMLPQFAAYIRDIVPRYAELQPFAKHLLAWLDACPASRTSRS
ncbi:MAG: phosphotransferase [Pseudomonadales bacterium]|nr:phosphotransferase [Pseudomonadales bacterium]